AAGSRRRRVLRHDWRHPVRPGVHTDLLHDRAQPGGWPRQEARGCERGINNLVVVLAKARTHYPECQLLREAGAGGVPTPASCGYRDERKRSRGGPGSALTAYACPGRQHLVWRAPSILLTYAEMDGQGRGSSLVSARFQNRKLLGVKI